LIRDARYDFLLECGPASYSLLQDTREWWLNNFQDLYDKYFVNSVDDELYEKYLYTDVGDVASFGDIELVIHAIVLPYHHASWFLSKAILYATSALQREAQHDHSSVFFAKIHVLDFWKTIYQNLHYLTNDKITEMGAPAVTNLIWEKIMVPSGFQDKANYTAEMTSWNLEWAARVGWKHSTASGVYSSPTFWVNTCVIDQPASLDDWSTLFDNLKNDITSNPYKLRA